MITQVIVKQIVRLRIFYVAAVLMIMPGAFGYTTNVWKGVSGRWDDAGNWTGGVPTAEDVASFPRSRNGYTVTIDGATTCRYIRNEGGTAGGVVTFTGGGSLTCSGSAAGPSVSCYLSSGAKLSVTNLTLSMTGFNPYNGTFTVGEKANVTVSTFYMNGGDSALVVKDGEVYVSSFSIRTSCSITINGGSVSFPGIDCRYSNVDRAVTFAQNGGDVTLRSVPSHFSNAEIAIAGGVLKWPTSSFSPPVYGAWLPKSGGSLVLRQASYTALSTDGHPDATVSFDGSVFVTNNLADCTTENPGSTTGIYAYTNTTFSGTGALYANFIFARGTCTVDIAKLCLGHRMHFTNAKCVMMVPHGLEFGAYGDWTTDYNKALSYFYGPITVDTSDCFDATTPRRITFGHTTLDGDVTYRVRGTGTNVLWAGAAVTPISALAVEPGATFRFRGYQSADSGAGSGSTGVLRPEALSVAAGATIVLDANKSSIAAVEVDISDTARIEVNVPASITAGLFYPLLVDGALSSYTDRVRLTGAGAEAWSAKCVAGATYLTDGNPTTSTYGDLPYGWTGAAGGNFSDGGNWSGETELTSSNEKSADSANARSLYFGRAAQNIVTNDLADSTYNNGAAVCNMGFLSSAGPYEVHGNMITFYSESFSNNKAPIASESSFPVVFYAPVRRGSGTFAINSLGTSHILMMGDVTSSSAYLFERGDVRFGGKAVFSGLFFGSGVGSLTVLDGGHLYITRYNHALRGVSYAASSATLSVKEGGVFACGAEWAGGTATPVKCRIDGSFAVSNTLYSMKNMPFSGSGAVYLGGVAPSNATVEAQFSGNLTLNMGGDWQPVSARCPNTPFTLAVTSGNLLLKAAADWSYGIPDGVESTTTAAERAITVAEDATLTFGASDFKTTLRDGVIASGNVVFEDGCRLAFAGFLRTSMHPRTGDWTTFATAASIAGVPLLPDVYEIRTVENGDGTVSMQARARAGTMLLFR